MWSSTNFAAIVRVPTSILHMYATGDKSLYIIRPTDNVTHPNADLYNLGDDLLEISDLTIPDHDEVVYSFEIEHDLGDQWQYQNTKVLGISRASPNIIMDPIEAHMALDDTKRLSVYFVLKIMVPIEYRAVEPS